MSLSSVSPTSEAVRRDLTLEFILNASRSLSDIFKPSFGPKGTYKMLVSGSGEIKVTKDGGVLLGDMSIIHPVAAFIAKALSGVEGSSNGKISTIILIAEILNNCELFTKDGYHPSVIVEGLEAAFKSICSFIDSATKIQPITQEFLRMMAKNILATKIPTVITDKMSEITSQAVWFAKEESTVDLTMIEIISLNSGSLLDSQIIQGLVLDHGGRHPNMPKRLENVGILLLNVSLEYEKTEINSGMFYKSAEDKEKLAEAERSTVINRTQKIIDFLRSCPSFGSFLIVNLKGIEPVALDLFAKNSMTALRRAKRRNMDRLLKLCGGCLFSSIEDLDQSGIGSAGLVHEKSIGDEKYTFVENTPLSKSCTILLRGSSDHSIKLCHEAVKSTLKDLSGIVRSPKVCPGAGSMFLQISKHLRNVDDPHISAVSRSILGYSMENIFKVIYVNSGISRSVLHERIHAIMSESCCKSISILDGTIIDPSDYDLWESSENLRGILGRSISVASTLLMTDEVLRAGKSIKKSEE